MNRLSELNISNKNLVIRVDMNVPIKDGAVVDNTRIIACMPTIKFALENNAKVLLITHLGRPTEGSFEEQFSLKPLVIEISKILECNVDLVDSLDSSEIFNSSSNIQILENIRFFAGEKTNSNELGRALSSLGDIYVFDAFGTSHREQASTHSAIAHSNSACAGILLEKEIEALTKALNESMNPYTAIIGGSKVSTKLELIKNINTKADYIIVGGGIANTFIKAAGHEVGISLFEESMVHIAKDLLKDGKIILPKTVVTSKTFEGDDIQEKNIAEVRENEMILDQFLNEEIESIISTSRTILWNGPLGVFENKYFSRGTEQLSNSIAKSDGFSIAGGGETLTAINKFINKDDVSYCSTGGGAFLEFMEGKDLPSIAALKAKV
ncbi:phosphoglycerate kinase [Gammaproteobacteria bacterium]|jgi:phosphoglycerate kinase|nr:phosphoglycerate kinase [Gammaproteobacteria bacterium]MDB2447579.1 phosphoglycerate kinase [Gammaproteobacteria bacterium]MDC1073831.1 phosphoglycerate kinase [Gammaproteobacteria bacterium]MDC3411481.1 phosphoglycerate kinase [Gammaproteobacteria bacterium]